MNNKKIQKIRAEIERRITLLEKNNVDNPVLGVSAGIVMEELRHLLSYIDSLEESVSEDLEKEILRYKAEEHKQTAVEGQTWEFDWDDILLTIEDAARHFAQWQKKQMINEVCDSLEEPEFTMEIKKETIEEQQQSQAILYGLDGRNPQEDKPISDDLKKAADEWDGSLYRSDAFIAGAEWQKQKDSMFISEDLEKEVYEHLWKGRVGADVAKPIYFSYDELLEVARHFAEWQKQQLMKDAVGLVIEDASFVNLKIEGIKKDDKVKLIIIKGE